MKYYIELARYHKDIKYFDWGITSHDFMEESETFYKGMEFTTMVFNQEDYQEFTDIIDNIMNEIFNIS